MRKMINIKQIIFCIILFPIVAMAESRVPYNNELDYYIGTWECTDNIRPMGAM